MAKKLIGSDDGISNVPITQSYISYGRFVALASGNMTQFLAKANSSANFKVGIYTDVGGSLGTLMAGGMNSTAVSPGWNTIPFVSTPLTLGTYYWLAINCDTYNAVGCASAGGTAYYAALSYSSNFPTTPSGLYSVTWNLLIAGWGIKTNSGNPVSFGNFMQV